jgi:hypothetical protein
MEREFFGREEWEWVVWCQWKYESELKYSRQLGSSGNGRSGGSMRVS